MANLREIKKRIGSVSTTEQITRTMEMVATAKIKRALDREKRSEAFRDAITDVTAHGCGRHRGRDGLSASRESRDVRVRPHRGNQLLIEGLAGGFNVQIDRAVEKRIEHFRRHGAKRIELITCGRKVSEYFSKYPDVVMQVVGESDNPSIERARAIASYIEDGFSEGKFGRVDIIYHHAKNRVEQVLREERILPLDPVVLKTLADPATTRTRRPSVSRRPLPMLLRLSTS